MLGFVAFFIFFLLFPWLEETNDRFPGTILASRLSVCVCVCVWRVHETAELLDALREREEEEEEKEKEKKRELKN